MRLLRSIVRVTVAVVIVLFTIAIVYQYGRTIWVPAYLKLMGKRTVADVVKQYGPAARERLRSRFDAADCLFPPARIALLAFKDSRRVELYAENDGRWSFIRDYPIVAASGNAGPKLREGDRQVPEGIYAIDGLNPNSAFHLSMKVNYPNEFDRAMAGADGRTDLGGDIFIHGRDASIGCLAMGDAAIEELFTLAAEVGIENSRVVIAPTDLRTQTPERYDAQPVWLPELYANVRAELQRYPPAAPIHLVTDS